MKVQRILHYPGSKWRTAEWIISHFPQHKTYCEPFFGSGAVLFSKSRSIIETVNDLDGDKLVISEAALAEGELYIDIENTNKHDSGCSLTRDQAKTLASFLLKFYCS